jgi:hypothetical protein
VVLLKFDELFDCERKRLGYLCDIFNNLLASWASNCAIFIVCMHSQVAVVIVYIATCFCFYKCVATYSAEKVCVTFAVTMAVAMADNKVKVNIENSRGSCYGSLCSACVLQGWRRGLEVVKRRELCVYSR